MRFLLPDVIDAARKHAMDEYPRESCGGVTEDGYVPFLNLAKEPEEHFACDEEMEPLLTAGRLLALIHSHPDGPLGPSEMDMSQQIAMDIPWGIVMATKNAALPPWFWSDDLPRPPLLGRDFRHGPSGSDGKGDCYALIRDYYLLERKISLPEFPRGDEWWRNGKNMYVELYEEAGFSTSRQYRKEPLPGDVLLMQYGSKTVNHGGVFLGEQMMMHHLHNRRSERTPVIRYMDHVCFWLRHDG